MATKEVSLGVGFEQDEAFKYSLRHISPIKLLLAQRAAAANFGIDNAAYTPPGAINGHYPHLYLWDSCFSGMVYAENGHIAEAMEEMDSVMNSMRADGMIPNITPAPSGREFSPEKFTYRDPKGPSEYTQPPIMADTFLAIYEQCVQDNQVQRGQKYIEKHYPALKKAYNYFDTTRHDDVYSPLISNIHSNETGRDSDPTFDFIKFRLARSGEKTHKLIDLANVAIDYAGMALLSIRNRSVDWDISKIREHFWFKDVLFNALYAKNLETLSELARLIGKNGEAAMYQRRATAVNQAISEKMWDPEAVDDQGRFYGIDAAYPVALIAPGIELPGRNTPGFVRKESISNLGPLIISSLPEEQLTSLINQIDTNFATPYMLPTVPKNSPDFDPHHQQRHIMWRGPVWMWMNRLFARALLRQSERTDLTPESDRILERCYYLSKRIVADSVILTSHGYHEFFNPLTGQGYRTYPFSGSAAAPVSLASIQTDKVF